MIRVAAMVMIVACGHSPGDAPTPTPKPSPSPSDTPMSSNRSWRSHSISNLGLTVSLIEGLDIQDRVTGDLHAVAQHDRYVDLLVYAGSSATLAWWRNRFAPTAKLGTETAVQVCGRSGHRQEVTAPAESATGVFPTADGGFEERTGDRPARVHVAIDGTTSSGVGFVASWVVDADHRDAMRADEDRFLASITCS